MKRITGTTLGYAFLLLIPLTFSHCFIFHRHKSVTKNSTDSTAYNKIESSLQQHQEEAWDKYLNKTDSSHSGVTFYPSTDNSNQVVIHPDGTIEAKGSIQNVWHSRKSVTTERLVIIRKITIIKRLFIKRYYHIRTITVKKNISKERKPDYFGYFKIAAVLALVVFVVVKWQVIKAKVVNWLKGWFTGI